VPSVPAGPTDLLFSLVVPTYNERANIEAFLRRTCAVLSREYPEKYEVLVVDDDSPDGTWEAVAALQGELPAVQLIRRQQERGLATAVICGWQQARGALLGAIDGDGQHPPETLLALLTKMQEGADLAVGSRYVGGGSTGDWSALRLFLSAGAMRLALLWIPEISGRLSDPMSGLFVVRRAAIADCPLSPVGYKILLEVMGRGRIERVTEVGFAFDRRQAGHSKVTWREYLAFLQHLLRLRFATGEGAVGRLGRFLRFAVVGTSGVAVDFAVLLLLQPVVGDEIWAKIGAIEVAIANNFYWNDRWTFADARGRTSPLVRFLRFNLACTLGALINLTLFLILRHFGANLGVANLGAIAASTLWNYLVNLRFNWRIGDDSPP